MQTKYCRGGAHDSLIVLRLAERSPAGRYDTTCYLKSAMICYKIPYSHKFGSFVASKWAQTPEEAVALVKKCQGGMAASTGAIIYGKAVPETPQPFEGPAPAIVAPAYLKAA